MSTIPTLHRNADQLGIADLIAYIEQRLSTNMASNSFAAMRHFEHMCVAVSYVHEYYKCQGRRPSLFDLAVLDGDAVADWIASDLDPEGKAGIAHSVNLLVEHAQKLLDETPVTVEQILSGTPSVWNISTRYGSAKPNPESTGGHYSPDRIEITINLLRSTPGDGPSGGDSTVVPQ